MKVRVKDGVAIEVKPNCDADGIHPANGKVCVKAYGLIQKAYNPSRIRTPMKRSNPKKGRHEDPGFVPISWDQALEEITEKMRAVREQGLQDEAGLPRLAVSFGHGGTPSSYMGTLPAFLSSWGGPIDFSFGSGQGVGCTHSEHLYGEYWHRGFTVCADTVNTNYVLSFGANLDASGGPCATWRHAEARARGAKRVQIEPHLSVTGGASAQWVPIKPKTDMAFMFGMINVLLFEHTRDELDIPFLRDSTASPYLVGPQGHYLRDPESGKPLVWDTVRDTAVAHDTPDIVPALDGSFRVLQTQERGPDEDRYDYDEVEGRTAFSLMADVMAEYTPEWAQSMCDVPAATIREIANEFLDNACIGETVEVDGDTLPFRPVAVVLGKTVSNGWGAYQCCWGRTMLAVLVGALEVPGGTLGTTTRLNKPLGDRIASCTPGDDGFMATPLNPTGKDTWEKHPSGRNAHKSLIPIVGSGPWSQALGPSHLAWMFLEGAPEGWERPSYPDIWIIYRSNPGISFWELDTVVATAAKMPFTVAFAYTIDETNYMADYLLPDAPDLESTQLIRIGGTKFVEQIWDHEGLALRQPIVEPQGDSRDMTWIATELAKRTGLMEPYYKAINRGAGGVPLKGDGFDYSLDPSCEHSVDEVWDAACKAGSTAYSKGEVTHDLDWFKEHGFYTIPYKREDWYLYPTMRGHGLRFELPYQERLTRSGQELGRRLHEKGVNWWDSQLKEYQAIPHWHDVPALYEEELERSGGKSEDYPFWGITAKSAQYAAGNNVTIQLMNEVGSNVRGHGSVIMNAGVAKRLGIDTGDMVEVSSTTGVTRGRAEPVQGIRPDTICMVGQFDHWATPYAKELGFPSLNTLTPMSLELTDATGSGADLVRVSVRAVGAKA
ncbi:MAG: molybdopterin-dependent oxidoreductase [Proteobacteria bacterium]|nr:molybdopterin-dependent oxidoreductase [Pseudomonadota bacterium]